MPKRNRNALTAVCEYCEGAGVLVDKNDPTVGILCAGCDGRGHRELTYVPFTGRKKIPGIKRVRRSGTGLVNLSPKKPVMISYADFLKGKRP